MLFIYISPLSTWLDRLSDNWIEWQLNSNKPIKTKCHHISSQLLLTTICLNLFLWFLFICFSSTLLEVVVDSIKLPSTLLFIYTILRIITQSLNESKSLIFFSLTDFLCVSVLHHFLNSRGHARSKLISCYQPNLSKKCASRKICDQAFTAIK